MTRTGRADIGDQAAQVSGIVITVLAVLGVQPITLRIVQDSSKAPAQFAWGSRARIYNQASDYLTAAASKQSSLAAIHRELLIGDDTRCCRAQPCCRLGILA